MVAVNDKKVWRDPVWSKVIASLIFALIAAIFLYVKGLLPNVLDFFLGIYMWFGRSSNISNWLLIFFITICAMFTIGIIALFVGLRRSKLREEESPFSYREDKFFEITWRWKYGSNGDVYDIASFCTMCDYQIMPQNVAAYSFIDRILYYCDHCGRQWGPFEMSQQEMDSRVERYIHQKLRTGAWKDSKVS